MIDEFMFWLLGIEEDTPIPYEIKYLYFCIHRENGGVFLSFGGKENADDLALNFDYMPLEAQYFYSNKLETSNVFFKVRKLIENVLTDSSFNYLNSKDLFLAEYGKEIIYNFRQNTSI